MLTAEQVTTMSGPETPNCDCSGCKLLVAMKRAICSPVTKLDTDDGAAWVAAIVVAANRCAAQGVPLQAMVNAVSHGVNQAVRLNPMLCGVAPSSERLN